MNRNKKSKINKSSIMSILMFAGIILGCIVGLLWENASMLEPLGTLYINMMMCLVVPLVFFSVSSTIGNMTTGKKSGKTVTTAILMFTISSLITGIFAMVFFKVFPMPRIQISVEPSDAAKASVTVFSAFAGLLSQSEFLSLFNVKAITALITAAVIFGFSIQKCGGAESPAAKLFTNLYGCLVKSLEIISYYMPIGLFGVFATLVSSYGASIIKDYINVLILIIAAVVLYFILAAPLYTLFAAGGTGLKIMFRHIWNIIPVAFGTRSSIATAPTSIKQAKDSGLSDDICNIVIPLGANMNMNGTVISAIGRVLFLFAFFGRTITTKEAIVLVIVIVFCTLYTPGIPSGSNITSSLALSIFFGDQYGLAMALIAPIGKMIDPFSTTVNATMDYIMCFVVTRFVEGKNRLKKDAGE